ncbi:hypothetical protein FO519_008621 [Halicephalobus sp. NKZ332]|nr:hypothetical protein FO519_008621 [Halicephalobus sp. NKZ332]
MLKLENIPSAHHSRGVDLGSGKMTTIRDSFEEFESASPEAEMMYDNPNTEDLDTTAIFRSILLEMNQTSDNSMMNYSLFPKPSTNYVKLVSVVICNILGALCLLLNLFVIFALIRNRRRVLRNVFYVLVLHCAFVDLIRGACLIAWGMPHLWINNMHTMRDRWLISLLFGVGSVFSNFFESAHSVMVLNNDTIRFSNDSPSSGVTRRETGGVSINVVSMLMIFVLCYLCLFTVLICYGTILRTIRKFHNFDDKGRFHSEESQRITTRSLYCRHHDDSTKTNNSNNVPQGEEDPNNPNRRCNSHRKWRSHLMSRHKYLIVIGSVLFVDVLFLFPYSGIQLVAFLHLNNMLATSPRSTMIRWGLQVYECGLKFIPLGQTKDQLGTNEEEIALRDNQSRDLAEPLIKNDANDFNDINMQDESDDEKPLGTPTVTKLDSQFLGTNWTRLGSSKFRTYGIQEDDPESKKFSNFSGLRSSTCFEIESSMASENPEGENLNLIIDGIGKLNT